MAVLKRRSRMITFRLSEDEYVSLKNLCEEKGARSVSDIARDAVHRLIDKDPHRQVENMLKNLEGRVNTMDLQIRQLELAVGATPKAARYSNGKA
jgi:hypothetical protein